MTDQSASRVLQEYIADLLGNGKVGAANKISVTDEAVSAPHEAYLAGSHDELAGRDNIANAAPIKNAETCGDTTAVTGIEKAITKNHHSDGGSVEKEKSMITERSHHRLKEQEQEQLPDKRPPCEPSQNQPLPPRITTNLRTGLTTLRVHKSAPAAVDSDSALLADEKRQQLQDMLSRKTAEILTVKPVSERVDLDTQEVEPSQVATASPAAEKTAPIVKNTVDNLLDSAVKSSVDSSAQDSASLLLAWGDNGRPLWAEKRFDVLLFDVSGLSLAVPLVALGQILTMSDKLTVLQGQSDWFMGILPSTIGDIRTVNTSLFVMPERYQKSFLDTAKYVVTIDGMRWGLAVDSVKQPISLNPEDVKWRTHRSQRPWLAGTVKSHMCALLDIPQIGELLNRADKNYGVKS